MELHTGCLTASRLGDHPCPFWFYMPIRSDGQFHAIESSSAAFQPCFYNPYTTANVLKDATLMRVEISVV